MVQGFRRYDKIRDTLCHELAHMVFSEHNNDFKELNSLLLRECSQLDWTAHQGRGKARMRCAVACRLYAVNCHGLCYC